MKALEQVRVRRFSCREEPAPSTFRSRIGLSDFALRTQAQDRAVPSQQLPISRFPLPARSALEGQESDVPRTHVVESVTSSHGGLPKITSNPGRRRRNTSGNATGKMEHIQPLQGLTRSDQRWIGLNAAGAPAASSRTESLTGSGAIRARLRRGRRAPSWIRRPTARASSRPAPPRCPCGVASASRARRFNGSAASPSRLWASTGKSAVPDAAKRSSSCPIVAIPTKALPCTSAWSSKLSGKPGTKLWIQMDSRARSTASGFKSTP